LRRLQCDANFLFALSQLRAVIRPNGGRTTHLTQASKAIAERSRGAPGRRRRIIQFVGQTRRQLAERRELFSLLVDHREGSDAIGQHAYQALREVRHAMQHFRKVLGVHRQDAHRTNGARSQGHYFHS